MVTVDTETMDSVTPNFATKLDGIRGGTENSFCFAVRQLSIYFEFYCIRNNKNLLNILKMNFYVDRKQIFCEILFDVRQLSIYLEFYCIRNNKNLLNILKINLSVDRKQIFYKFEYCKLVT